MPKVKRKSKRAAGTEKTHAVLEATIIILVVIVGIIAVYLMFQINAGKAFYQPPQIKVIQTELQFCCCETQNGKLFEVFGKVLKNTDEILKEDSCREACEVEHASQLHPVKFLNVGKCGSVPRLA